MRATVDSLQQKLAEYERRALDQQAVHVPAQPSSSPRQQSCPRSLLPSLHGAAEAETREELLPSAHQLLAVARRGDGEGGAASEGTRLYSTLVVKLRAKNATDRSGLTLEHAQSVLDDHSVIQA